MSAPDPSIAGLTSFVSGREVTSTEAVRSAVDAIENQFVMVTATPTGIDSVVQGDWRHPRATAGEAQDGPQGVGETTMIGALGAQVGEGNVQRNLHVIQVRDPKLSLDDLLSSADITEQLAAVAANPNDPAVRQEAVEALHRAASGGEGRRMDTADD